MGKLEQLRRDANSRTPDRWYYVQRHNGREISQRGFPTKELADGFKKGIDEATALWLSQGYKRRPGVTDDIVEAKVWKVGQKEFNNFGDALFYMWTECPSETIKGVF